MTKKIEYLENLGWYRSWDEQKPIDNNGDPQFWFNYPFISFLEQKLSQNLEIFEYGSGHSTLKFAKNCKNITSIDNNIDWHLYLKKIQPKNATLILQQDLDLYPLEITKFDKKYDIIVIDGKRRNACSKLAVNYLKNDGIIIFDNLEKGYQKSVDLFLANDFKLLEFTGIAPLKNSATITGIFYKGEI
ncbi:hypothetical protein N8772_02655 [Rickettsiales bacterium]|nr:hypothetical protein [Rickettsiales bacterium]MDB2550594.1 hypothetical protein [Rickettsiales bacterium]